jgi:hypothetical protein
VLDDEKEVEKSDSKEIISLLLQIWNYKIKKKLQKQSS